MSRDVLVVGAGMAGARVAELRAAAGDRVVVVDKGRRHGGRMASRRLDGDAADTGVTAFAAAGPSFTRALAGWADDGRAAPLTDRPERWRGTPRMRDLPAHVVGRSGATVRLATTVTALAVVDGRWRATITRRPSPAGTADATAPEVDTVTADALVLTAPAPQAAALLRTGGRLASPDTLAALDAVTYVATLAVVVRSGPTSAVEGADGRGTLRTLHRDVDPAVLDGDRAAAAATIVGEEPSPTGDAWTVVHVHGWRYAQVRTGIDRPALRDDTAGAPLVLAGDLFDASGDAPAGVRPEGVERAFHSAAAAARLLDGEGP